MSDYRHLTRRDFVRDGTLGALALGAGLTLPRMTAAAADKSAVVIVRDAKAMGDGSSVDKAILKKMLDQTIQQVTGEGNATTGWKKLIKSDDVVGLVPTPAVNPTHTELVDAVREALIEAGVAADHIQDVQRNKAAAAECTALITMPGLKVHRLTGIGTVMKNYILFSEKAAREYHEENSVNLAEIWNMPTVKGKTRLILVDCLRPLFHGAERRPNPQYFWNYNGLLASTDPVAAEATGLKILQAKRTAFKGEEWELTPPPLCVAAADTKFNLGNSDPARIDLKVSGWEEDLLISG
jgi:uncharacterized protein (DUF362 family)